MRKSYVRQQFLTTDTKSMYIKKTHFFHFCTKREAKYLGTDRVKKHSINQK